MPKPILSSRSRITAAQADALLKCYARRMEPAEVAKRTKLSLNTVYEQYARLRWRLVEVGYYRDAALSKDEDGLSEQAKAMLRQRRGLEDDDIYAHAAEIIVWLEEWPPGTVLRQLRKIIDLTGPIDVPLNLTDVQAKVVIAYVRYAKAKLISDRAVDKSKTNASSKILMKNAEASAKKQWRSYRTQLTGLYRRTDKRSRWKPMASLLVCFEI